jgi:hypothetical protein
MTLDDGSCVEVRIDFVCPFCGGRVQGGIETSSGDPVVFHTMPYCDLFDTLDPDRFLEAARKRMQS